MNENNTLKKILNIIIGVSVIAFFMIIGFFGFTEYDGAEHKSDPAYPLTPDDKHVKTACIRPWVYINADKIYSWTNEDVSKDYPDENCTKLEVDPFGSNDNYNGCIWEDCKSKDEDKTNIYRVKCTGECLDNGDTHIHLD